MAGDGDKWPRAGGKVLSNLWNILRVEYGRYCPDKVQIVADAIGEDWEPPTYGAKTKREPHNRISPHMAIAHVNKKLKQANADADKAEKKGRDHDDFLEACLEIDMLTERKAKLNQRWGQFSVEGMKHKKGKWRKQWEKVKVGAGASSAERDKYTAYKDKHGQDAYDWYIKNVFNPDIHGKVTGTREGYRDTTAHYITDCSLLCKTIMSVHGHGTSIKKGQSPYHEDPVAGR